MLALNITNILRGEPGGRPRDMRSCAERWWEIPDSALDGYADLILAVASNVIAGVFEVRGWRRDTGAGNKVVFDLADAPAWQWLVGQESPRPITWRKSQVNPVRKVGGVIADELRARRPHHIDAGHGWSLDVDPNGNAAVVRGPGCMVVTALGDGAARLCLIPASPHQAAGA
jgi:hypothetical protein